VKPSIGRVVHYQSYGTPGGEHLPEPLAAIVTGVDDSFGTNDSPQTRVDLYVIYGNGCSHKANVEFAEEPTPGHWNWPPRV
jgi:hypothetical protein